MSTDTETFNGAVYITSASNQITLGSGSTVTLTVQAPSASRIYSIDDAGVNCAVVLTAGDQTIAGKKTFTEDLLTQKNLALPSTADGSHGVITIGAQPFLHSYGDTTNTFAGINSCIDNTPAPNGENTGVGSSCMASIVGGALQNTAVGTSALSSLQIGTGNTAMGMSSLTACVAGANNAALGRSSLGNCTGSRNIAVGYNAGSSVVSNDDTINIGNVGTTTAGEINIGTIGTHTKTSIAGIGGVLPGGTPQAVIIDPTTGQLGSQVIPTAGVSALAAIGTTPNADGATLVGVTLNLEPASASFGGVLSTAQQTIAGQKTFSDTVIIGGDLQLPATTVSVGRLLWDGTTYMHTKGTDSVAVGKSVSNFTNTGINNILVGTSVCENLTTGSSNTCAGYKAGQGITTGTNNTLIGSNAGRDVTTGSNNIIISGDVGTSGLSNTIQLGTAGTHTSAVIAGIAGVSPGGTPQAVIINPATGQLGSQAFPGVTSVGAIGAGPVTNGASISGTTLTLAAATATSGGVLTNTTQSIQGLKTFVNHLTSNGNINVGNTASVGVGNVVIGACVLHNYSVNATKSNVFLGYNPGNYTTNSANNVAIGSGTLSAVTTGSSNICLGKNAGSTITTTSDNILISNTGAITDSGAIKIGTAGTQTSAYVAGIAGVSPGGTPQAVIVNPTTGQLGSQAFPGVTSVGAIAAGPVTNGASITGTTLTLAAATATSGGVLTNAGQSIQGDKTFVDQLITNKNVSLPDTSGAGSGNIAVGSMVMHNYSANATRNNVFLGMFAGNYSTDSTNNVGIGAGALSGITTGTDNVCIGRTAGTALSTNSNNILIYNTGTETDSGVIRIGTLTSQTSVYVAGIASVNPGGTPQAVIVNPATGQLGSQVIPAAGVSALTAIGSSPNANGATLTGVTLNLEPASASFGGVLTNTTQSVAGDKTFIDQFIANKNVTLSDAVDANTGNVAVGSMTLHNYSANATKNNIFLGSGAGNYTTDSTNNVGIGAGALGGITTGTDNVCIGRTAGLGLSTNSNNILIYNTGTETDSGVIRIGTLTSQTSAYVAGIAGVSPGGTPQAVIINPTTGQLGSQAFPGVTSVGAISAGPVSFGASITDTTLNLAAATATSSGILTTGTQSILGLKTFIDTLSSSANLQVGNTTGTVTGNVVIGDCVLHNYSSNGIKSNVFIGYSCGNYTNSSTNNVGLGNGALSAVSTGGGNICLGQSAGSAITTTGNNIMISNTGVVTDSGVIKFGTSGTHTSAYIAGIASVSPGGTPQAVIINPTTGQLGSQAIPTPGVSSLAAIGVTPNANGATISGTTLNLEAANGSFGGIMTTGTQTLAGAKTFTNSIIAPNFIVPKATLSPTINLPSGKTVTTMTVRGATATIVPVSMTRSGDTVAMTIAAFEVTAISSGTTVNIIGFITTIDVSYRPTYDQILPCVIRSSGANALGILNVAATGLFNLVLPAAGNFTLPFGLTSDITACWSI